MEVTGRAAVSFAVIQDPTFHRPSHRPGVFFVPHPSEVIPGPLRGRARRCPVHLCASGLSDGAVHISEVAI